MLLRFSSSTIPAGVAEWKQGSPSDLAPHVDGVEAVDVFRGVYCLDYRVFVDMARQGELDDESVDFRVVVQTFNGGYQLALL